MFNGAQTAVILHGHFLLYEQHHFKKPYSVDVWSKLAGEDEAVDALLQAGDVHDLHKVALHSAELLRITQSLVFGVLTLHIRRRRGPGTMQSGPSAQGVRVGEAEAWKGPGRGY